MIKLHLCKIREFPLITEKIRELLIMDILILLVHLINFNSKTMFCIAYESL